MNMIQQKQITTTTKQRIRQCPVCDKTIQIAYSEYCLGCLQELRAILSTSATATQQVSYGARCC
jgi:hypothetical protein